jgi:hypothetical protein
MGRRITRRLQGKARLSDGHDFNTEVEFQLLHTSAEIGCVDNPKPILLKAADDIITGRLELPAGSPIPAGQTMTLTSEDGTKLRVITGFNGKVTGTGSFFR